MTRADRQIRSGVISQVVGRLRVQLDVGAINLVEQRNEHVVKHAIATTEHDELGFRGKIRVTFTEQIDGPNKGMLPFSI